MEQTFVLKGFIILRHLDHFAHWCYPPGLCKHFAVTHDQNGLSGLIAPNFFSKKNSIGYCQTIAILFKSLHETGVVLKE